MISTNMTTIHTALEITNSTKSKLYYYRKVGLLQFDSFRQMDFFNIVMLKILTDFIIPKNQQKYIYQLIQDCQKVWKFDTNYHIIFNDGVEIISDLNDLKRLNTMTGQRFICLLHLPTIYNEVINKYYELI